MQSLHVLYPIVYTSVQMTLTFHFAPTVIYSISEDFDLNFNAMFACVGLWNAFFLLIYSLFDASKLMRWSSRYGHL